MLRRAHLPLFALAVWGTACGAKTDLRVGPPRDAGPIDTSVLARAICPPSVRVTPLSQVTLVGRVEGASPSSVRVRWSIASTPAGSAARPPLPSDAATTSFTPDVVGEYRLRFEVLSGGLVVSACDALVIAFASEGLRVEMYWNGPPDRSCEGEVTATCDPTDVDLHLLHPRGVAWRHETFDCHYENCTGGDLSWGGPSPADDPRLDIDDVDGFGPENINVDVPEPGTYRVGVHFFGDNDAERQRDATVVVNVYCGMGGVTPVASFGPVRLRGEGATNDDFDFWRVADVRIGTGATPCTVVDLSVGGGRTSSPMEWPAPCAELCCRRFSLGGRPAQR